VNTPTIRISQKKFKINDVRSSSNNIDVQLQDGIPVEEIDLSGAHTKLISHTYIISFLSYVTGIYLV
jgi:hypothetical protein